MLSTVLFWMPSLAFPRAARSALEATLPAEVVGPAWRRTLALHASMAATRTPRSRGVDHLLRYGEWDCALYRALPETGVPAAKAGAIVERINWAIFGPVTRALFRASRLRSAKLQTRVRWVLDVMFGVLFTPPFQRRIVSSERDVAFEITACPLAEFCREQGVPELTRHAACEMDALMARDWGVALARTHTIAEGHATCDFRFQIAP